MNSVIKRVRKSLNIKSASFDDELADLIAAARADMIDSGIPREVANDDNDPLVVQAIKAYCKADQYSEEPQIAQGYQATYKSITDKLSLKHGTDGGK